MTASEKTRILTHQQIASAREILTNPDQFYDIPSLFQTSWEILKAERGQAVDFERIRPPAHQSETTNGIIARVRSYARTKGYALSPEHSLQDTANGYVVEVPGGKITAPSVQRFNSGATGQDLRDPLATITANSWIKKPGGAAPLGIIAPHLLSLKNSARRSCSIENPHPTVLAGGGHSALISPVLMNVANSKTTGRGPNVWDTQEPARTITSASGLSIIAPVLTYAQQGGRSRDIIGPHHTITASNKDQNAVIAPYLAQHNKARAGHNPGRAINAPISTLTATGSQQSVIAPLIARHFGQSTGHAISDPLGTVTAGGGGKSGLIAPWIAKYYGTGDGARSDEPLHTVTVKDRMGHMQAELAAPEFSGEHHDRAREVAEFLRSQGVWDGGEFVTVTIKATAYVVVDIGMRMLTPRELFNAQGFPSDYVIEGVWHQDGEDWTFKPFTKHQQVSCVGNSVCPGIARALAAANCAHLVADTHPEQKEACNG
ncbi:MAG: DNA cytosine methyltransferase [Rhodobacteraceae bacterium]|nr:DNA cytosine methyltransferase [Paracoccaceae bacterium]